MVGAFFIYRTEVRPFTDKQIELVKNFAAQAVIAIENTRLLNELRQRTDDLSELLQQQTATADVLKVISSSPGELEPVFQAMLENAVRVCGAKFGNLWLREGDVFRIGATYGAPQAYVELSAQRASTPARPRNGPCAHGANKEGLPGARPSSGPRAQGQDAPSPYRICWRADADRGPDAEE